MEDISIANEHFKAVCDKYERDFEAQVAKLDSKETNLKVRLAEIKKKRLDPDRFNFDVSDDDLVEVNAGGKIITAKRSTLTQFEGTRFEALFSGRWDKKLQRESHGRIFLDINPACFRAIVDYLNEMAISSEDSPLSPLSVSGDYKHILRLHLELFGLGMTKMHESDIIKTVEEVNFLHDWLEEDGLDGEFDLLYRGSRDGLSNEAFHSKCDRKGCTLIIIETIDGFVFGGYSNLPWTSPPNCGLLRSEKTFLFLLSGSGISSPFKIKLKKANYDAAVYHYSNYGPTFGTGPSDMYVSGSSVSLNFGHTYESGPLYRFNTKNDAKHAATLTIKEIEVFEVTASSLSSITITTKVNQTKREVPQVEPVTRFSEDVNEAINKKQKSLLRAELEISEIEDTFKDEQDFIPKFVGGDTKDVIVLNVSGATMATKRSTLRFSEDSVLAQQFDDSKWTEQGCNALRVKEWGPDEVASWVSSLQDMPADVGRILKENEIKGRELLALNMEGLKLLDITRPGTACLLLEEIKGLKKASQDIATFIEHSPYCFGKILDYLRLKRLNSQGLVENPALPIVCQPQKCRFEKVVRYYFPGDSSKFILG